MPPEENKTQDVPQQNDAQKEPVVEASIPVEQPVKPEPVETPINTVPEIEPTPTTSSSAPAQAEPVQTLLQPQNKITPQGRTSPVAPPSSASPRGTTFSRDFVQKLLVKARAKIQERKQKKLDKIMALFPEVSLGTGDAKRITNKEIQKLLRISRVSAFRYFNILEKQNRIKQVGNTGKSVFYTKI